MSLADCGGSTTISSSWIAPAELKQSAPGWLVVQWRHGPCVKWQLPFREHPLTLLKKRQGWPVGRTPCAPPATCCLLPLPLASGTSACCDAPPPVLTAPPIVGRLEARALAPPPAEGVAEVMIATPGVSFFLPDSTATNSNDTSASFAAYLKPNNVHGRC